MDRVVFVKNVVKRALENIEKKILKRFANATVKDQICRIELKPERNMPPRQKVEQRLGEQRRRGWSAIYKSAPLMLLSVMPFATKSYSNNHASMSMNQMHVADL